VLDAVMYAAINGIKLGAAATAVAGFGKLILPFQCFEMGTVRQALASKPEQCSLPPSSTRPSCTRKCSRSFLRQSSPYRIGKTKMTTMVASQRLWSSLPTYVHMIYMLYLSLVCSLI
jgi:hypothetical protein